MSCLRSTVELVEALEARGGRLVYAGGRWSHRAGGLSWRVHGLAGGKAVREGLVIGGALDDFGARAWTLNPQRPPARPATGRRENSPR